jgi:hypothetical protein
MRSPVLQHCSSVVALWLVVTMALAGPAPDRRPGARATLDYSGTVTGLEQARPRADGAWVVPGRVSGNGTVQAGHLVFAGTVAPGDSPGCIDFGGDVTFQSTASLLIELGGTTPCSEYDRITVAGALTLNGPTLQLVLLPGFAPVYGDRFDILDWGGLIGTFGSIDSSAAALPFPLAWDTSELYLAGELRVGVQAITDGDLAPWDSPNGVIDAGDVLIATQLALGRRTAGPLQLAHGDMNGDEAIDLVDLLLILQLVLQ